jgi:hypothetical protein
MQTHRRIHVTLLWLCVLLKPIRDNNTHPRILAVCLYYVIHSMDIYCTCCSSIIDMIAQSCESFEIDLHLG